MEPRQREGNTRHRSSAEETFNRFATDHAAHKYRVALDGTKTHGREIKCIRRALKMVPAGSRVLDLPCGTGRLFPFLKSMGYRVVSADSSYNMARFARDRIEGMEFAEEDYPLVTSIFDTGFKDGSFDAVVCNRLFHHFREPAVRRLALRELGRICNGAIVVSFFCNLSIDAMIFHARNALVKNKRSDRIPIGYGEFSQDVREAGLRIEGSLATRFGISRQWYLVLRS